MKTWYGLIFIICLTVPAFSAEAASLRLVPTRLPVQVGDLVGVTLKLDTATTRVNAFELNLQYDSSTVTYIRAEDAASVTSFWIEAPVSCATESVCLSGMVPGGFIGLDQELVTVYFEATQVGTTTIAVSGARVLAHDGKGTPVPLETDMLQLVVTEGHGAGYSDSVVDTEPPEPFTLTLTRDADIEDGAQVLVFSTKDKQSGVAAYYVKETRFPWLHRILPWTKVESPYRLKDQTLESTVMIKAVDFSGNERISFYYGSPATSVALSLFILLTVILSTLIWSIIKLREKLASRSGQRTHSFS